MGGADSPMVDVSSKINHCGAILDAWGSTRTKPEVAEIKRLKKVLERLHEGDQNEATRSEFMAASKQLDDLLLKQELYWAQRSSLSWLKFGDKNTKFSTQRLHNGIAEILYRALKILRECGLIGLRM